MKWFAYHLYIGSKYFVSSEHKKCHCFVHYLFYMLRLKELESLLSDVLPFENPKIHLEQVLNYIYSVLYLSFENVIYTIGKVATSPHLASRMLFTAASNFDDIKNCTVGDFGCGAGVK